MKIKELREMTNEELAKMVDTSDEWIVERTGIKARHFAALAAAPITDEDYDDLARNL